MNKNILSITRFISVMAFTALFAISLEPLGLISPFGVILIGVGLGLVGLIAFVPGWGATIRLFGETGIVFVIVGIGNLIPTETAVYLAMITLTLTVLLLSFEFTPLGPDVN